MRRSRRRRPDKALGYGPRHRRLRVVFAKDVKKGTCPCAICGQLIDPLAPWDLAHDDLDRKLWLGPTHPSCNRGTPYRLPHSREW